MYRDQLSGLSNMDCFYRLAQGYRNDSIRRGGAPILIALCLGQLHEYNALCGIEEGDRLLAGTARILQEVFVGDLVDHGAGERFYVLCDRAGVEQKAAKSEKRISGILPGDTIRFLAGRSSFPEDMSLSKALDQASTAAKSIGKSGTHHFCWFDENLEREKLAKSYILDCFLRAGKEHGIKVCYLPIVRSKDGRLCHLEALAHWQDPKHGLLSPNVFVPALEEAHRISELDFYMLEEVCRRMQREVEAGKTPIPVSVNFCAEDFEQEGALEKTLGILEAYRIPVSAIVLEITVREIASAQNTFCEKIRQFREAGFAIWMDNFGSGCSFLNVFGTYHFDLIKLDMVFISGLAGKEAMGQTEGSSERFWTVLLIPASTPSQRVWKQRDSLPFLPRQAASCSRAITSEIPFPGRAALKRRPFAFPGRGQTVKEAQSGDKGDREPSVAIATAIL